MPMPTVALVILAMLANSIASVLLKFASNHIHAGMMLPFDSKLLIIGAFSILTYAVAFFVYALVLRELPVSRAYLMITFGAQAILMLIGVGFLGEEYDLVNWLGVLLVAVGIILVARGAVK